MKLLIVLFFGIKLMFIKSEEMDCSFSISTDNLYTCLNLNLNIENNSVEVTIVNGEHLSGMSDDKVLVVYFLSSGMRNLPRGIFKVFKNLNKYIVSGLDTVEEYLNGDALIRGDFNGAKSLQALLFISVILENLRAKVFEGADNLIHLTLEACRITNIDKDAFLGLKKLQSLGMKFNYIAVLDPQTFSDLGELRHLLLSGNYLRKITREHFKGLRNMVRISIIGNMLEEIDQNITGLPNLEQFYLDQNICVDAHFGSDGIPFSKFKKEIARCSRDASLKEDMNRNLNEMRELEKEVTHLQKLVEKYRNVKCENLISNLGEGPGEGVFLKRRELP